MMEENYIEDSPWLPNVLVCARDIVTVAGNELFDRLPWNGIEDWLYDMQNTLPYCEYNDPCPTIFPVVLSALLSVLHTFAFLCFHKFSEEVFSWKYDTTAKLMKIAWGSCYSVITIAWGTHLISHEENRFFFNPFSILESWNPCLELNDSARLFLVFQMAYHLHFFCYAFVENEKRDIAFYGVMGNCMAHLLLCALLYYLGLHAPYAVFVVLFNLENLLQNLLNLIQIILYQESRKEERCLLTTIILLGILSFHSLVQMYWFPTKLTYFYLFTYPVSVQEAPMYLPLLATLLYMHSFEIYRYVNFATLAWTSLMGTLSRRKDDVLSKNTEKKKVD